MISIAEFGLRNAELKMKRKFLFILFLILGVLGTYPYAFSQSKIPPKTLTLVYSNNLNGEIDPCPT